MKNDDLLDAELSETPTEPLRGVRSMAVPLVAAALVTVSGCGVEVIGRTVSDAGSYPADAPSTNDAGIADAGPIDAPVTVVDAGIYEADSGGDDGK